MSRALPSLLAMTLLGAAACSSLGPERVAPDSFDYNQAVARSAHEQMLLNLVRLRYGEPPTFLDVSSVLTQYTWLGRAGLDGATGNANGARTDNVGASVGVTYAERPTITYSPLRGEAFAHQLLTPIPVELVFSLIQSGWPADELLMMSVQRLNNLHNDDLPRGSAPQQEHFARVIDLLIELTLADAVETVESDDGRRLLLLPAAVDPSRRALQDELRASLGLGAGLESYVLTRRATGRGADELLVRVRTLLDLMGYLSRGVAVPDEHVQEVRVEPATAAADHSGFPFRVVCHDEPPEDAFVVVPYQDHWFSISHSDHRSKRSFGLLTYLFQLMSPETSGAAPLLSVSAGG